MQIYRNGLDINISEIHGREIIEVYIECIDDWMPIEQFPEGPIKTEILKKVEQLIEAHSD